MAKRLNGERMVAKPFAHFPDILFQHQSWIIPVNEGYGGTRWSSAGTRNRRMKVITWLPRKQGYRLSPTPNKRQEGLLHRCKLVVLFQVELLYIWKHCQWIPCQGLRDVISDFLGHTEDPHMTEFAEKDQEW